jgi:hypothetical protein
MCTILKANKRSSFAREWVTDDQSIGGKVKKPRIRNLGSPEIKKNYRIMRFSPALLGK